ncbi:Long cell-linked locus protein, putative, expressed [Quillaja saponaria]|uniref:Long cell-linked locus protein, putative, expressed n=1 Tax=Quillaja saponaria TaxID=32244 RepID=A0AAD7Q9Z0_QUISA|nr:Long cell-linked locus protein, putative, expressed [Quillaja saponaria]
MPRKNSDIAHRAWSILRLALLWGRKGGVFKRRLVMELRLLPKYIKSLGHTTPRDQIYYRERELSFDKTPIIHVKMHRPASMRFHLPHIPCINPQTNFDYDFDGQDDGDYDDQEEYGYDYKSRDSEDHQMVSSEEEGIDGKAEEFIAKFYNQMKLQRQISYLQYNELLNRGTS